LTHGGADALSFDAGLAATRFVRLVSLFDVPLQLKTGAFARRRWGLCSPVSTQIPTPAKGQIRAG
jgi:hypothetical protein